MPLPLFGTDLVSRYPSITQVATLVLDPPATRVVPKLGDRIVAALRETGVPMSAADVAAHTGISQDDACMWFKCPSAARRGVVLHGMQKQRKGGKPAKMWILARD